MQANSFLSALQQGILICNRAAEIVYMNMAYSNYINHTLEEIKGQKITKYRKKAMVPTVLKTGQPIENMIRQEGSQEYFASVYPVYEEDRIIGTISIVTTIARHQLKFEQHQLTLKERVKEFEREEILAAISHYGDGVEGKKKAAESLGISLASLYNKLQY